MATPALGNHASPAGPRDAHEPHGCGLQRRASRRTGFTVLAAGLGAACAPPLPGVGSPAEPTPTASGTPGPRGAPPPLTLTGSAAALPGRLLLVVDANIWLLERGQMRPITTDRVSRQPSWSRDGTRIALVKLWTSGSDIWTVDGEGKSALELTDFTYREDGRQNYALQPIWWPDGARIAYLSQEGSHDTHLWLVGLADRRRQRFLTHGEQHGGLDHPRLAPDGRTLAVASFQPGRNAAAHGHPQIWTYTLPSGPWRQLTDAPGGAYDPEWSPDGARLAFTLRAGETARGGARHDVWVMRADGSGAVPVTASGFCRAPVWSPDGAWLCYLSARTGTFDVWAQPALHEAPAGERAPFGPPRQITQNGLIRAASGMAWAR